MIVVEDIKRSRAFYEGVLKQTVQFDFGENVSFEGGFAIHQKKHYESLINGEKQHSTISRPHNMELYFEFDDVKSLEAQLKEAGSEFVHAVQTQPWQQQVMRFYDPDGHIIEVGESMEHVAYRLHKQGDSVEEISKKIMMPTSMVEASIKKYS